MKKSQTYKSCSANETKKIGYDLAKHLSKGDVIALYGQLGVGKTTFVKGVAKGFGVRSEREVSSPSYVLIHEYRGRETMYHLDWYRLERVGPLDAEFALECFRNGVTLVEWPERGTELLPKKRIDVTLRRQAKDVRKIEIKRRGRW